MIAVNLPDALVREAAEAGKKTLRSTPKQIEHWARLGKAMEDNPDLPASFIIEARDSLGEQAIKQYRRRTKKEPSE